MYHPNEDNYNNQSTHSDKTNESVGSGEERKNMAVPVGSPYSKIEPSTPQPASYTTSTAPRETASKVEAAPAPAAPTPVVTSTTAYSHSTRSAASQSAAPQSTPVSGYYPQPPVQPGYPQGSYPNQPQQPRSSYTWNTQGPQQPNPYYVAQPQPPKKAKKAKKHNKLGLKIAAVVVGCAVVSAGSVGTFAALLQNGTIKVQSSGTSDSNKTAAFTINKVVDDNKETSTVTTSGQMSAQDVAEKVIPSVVCIQNYQISQQYYFGGMAANGSDTSEVDPAGQGSGIILSKDGYIVTNQHVVDSATSLKVITSDGLSYEAELVGEDSMTDLAVIKIDAKDLTPGEFGSSEDLRVADQVVAIGNPGGIQFNSSVTMGYVSALNREVTNSETGYTINCIQTDAAINPGNSGGALVDLYGHVVGINSSKIVATGYEGLGFAIPSDVVQPIVSDLMEYGYVKDRAMVGISGQFIDSMTARFYGLESGYYVQEINAENAQKAGLQVQDVITAIDDTQVTATNTISSYIAKKKPGEKVTLTVSRASAGKTVEIELTLSEYTKEKLVDRVEAQTPEEENEYDGNQNGRNGWY